MNLCGIEMGFDFTGLRLLYAGIAAFMWLFALLFSIEYMGHLHAKARYYIFMLVTFFATVGVFVGADLLTTFVFFEIMSFASYVLVIHEEDEKAMKAGEVYLGVAVICGMIMLMGIFMIFNMLGTVKYSEFTAAAAAYDGSKGSIYVPAIMLLIGFGAKAGMFPLHIWLPKAHPVAPAPASAILSGVLTKAGVFGMLTISMNFFLGDDRWGIALLMIGTITMCLGALLAIFAVDLKRVLACSSVSQIGFITYGIGVMCLLEGDEMYVPYTGTIWHMMNHSMIKLLLFCLAGAVMMKAHSLDLNRLRGYGRKKPLMAALFAVGALTIGGIPGTSGYMSKTILHEGLVEYMHHLAHIGVPTLPFKVIEYVFLFTGGCTIAYMLKLFVCLFVEKNADPELQAEYDAIDPWGTLLSKISLAAPACALIYMACTINEAHFYSWECLKGAFISLAVGLLVYFVFIRRVISVRGADGSVRLRNITAPDFDLEFAVYRPLIRGITLILAFVCSLLDRLPENIFKIAMFSLIWVCRFFACLADEFALFLTSTVLRPLEPVEKRVTLAERLKRSRFSEFSADIEEQIHELTASMSMGLVAAVVGLCAFLVYLLASLN